MESTSPTVIANLLRQADATVNWVRARIAVTICPLLDASSGGNIVPKTCSGSGPRRAVPFFAGATHLTSLPPRHSGPAPGEAIPQRHQCRLGSVRQLPKGHPGTHAIFRRRQYCSKESPRLQPCCTPVEGESISVSPVPVVLSSSCMGSHVCMLKAYGNSDGMILDWAGRTVRLLNMFFATNVGMA